jgi:hypothetical protein
VRATSANVRKWCGRCIRKLNELQQAESDPGDLTAEEYGDWLAAYGPEIEAADYGNIEPLRKRLPHLARFLFALPPRKRKKRQRNDAVATAVWAAQRIPEIWQREYDGRKNRPRDQVSAVAIASLWLDGDVSEDDILKRLKPSGPSGKKKKLPRAD